MNGLEPAGAPGGRRRQGRDAVTALTMLAVVVAGGVFAHANGVDGWERAVFREVNGLPAAVSLLVVPVMLLGTLWGVAALVVVAVMARHRALAVCMGAAGLAGYLLANLAKELTARGRPAAVLQELVVRGPAADGFGYPSGHVTVVAAVATAAGPFLSRRGRVAAWVLVAIVAFGRMFVGAHFPLDVLGGLALGVAVGSFVTFVAGRPARRQTCSVLEE